MPVFPARTTRKLRYATSTSIACTASTVASYVFSCNGLFDPDITSTGHQPMGFDQLMLSYNHYCVTGSKINVAFRNTASVPINVAIRVVADATVSTNADTILEFGLLNTDICETKNVSGSTRRLTESVSMRKIQGVDDVLDVAEMQGTVAANPLEQSYYHVSIWDPQAQGGTVFIDVIIEYVAVFMEPRVLSPSQVLALQRAIGIIDRTLPRPSEGKKC